MRKWVLTVLVVTGLDDAVPLAPAWEQWCYPDDCLVAANSQQPRPVRGKSLIRRCPSYDFTVFLSRADGEPLTHVVLLYDPKTEASGAN